MENLSVLTDSELEAGLQSLIGAETETLYGVLLHIREVDSRRLYLRRAKSNLFEYLVRVCRYSSPAAHRRIDAARLSVEIPEILPKIREGRLNLFQIGVLQRGVRQKEKEEVVTRTKKVEILAKLEACSFREVESIVAKELGLKVIARTSSRSQADESVRLSVTLCGRAWKKLEECRDLLSHSIPNGDWAQILEKLGTFYLAKKKRERAAASESEVPPRQPRPRRARASRKPPHEAPIPPNLRAFILARDRCCQWRDPHTNELCGSTFQLEIDHILMRSQGGTNDPANLRVLCGGHNRLEARDAGAGRPASA